MVWPTTDPTKGPALAQFLVRGCLGGDLTCLEWQPRITYHGAVSSWCHLRISSLSQPTTASLPLCQRSVINLYYQAWTAPQSACLGVGCDFRVHACSCLVSRVTNFPAHHLLPRLWATHQTFSFPYHLLPTVHLHLHLFCSSIRQASFQSQTVAPPFTTSPRHLPTTDSTGSSLYIKAFHVMPASDQGDDSAVSISTIYQYSPASQKHTESPSTPEGVPFRNFSYPTALIQALTPAPSTSSLNPSKTDHRPYSSRVARSVEISTVEISQELLALQPRLGNG